MNTDARQPEEALEDRPSTARMYDYLLGGYHNFQVDRDLADRALQLVPYLRQSARINRAFLRRAIYYVVRQGIDQFLDIGSGLPTLGNVHQIAQAANPVARVVYVDIDPIAVAHGSVILASNPAATAVQGDVRHPDEILNRPQVRSLLDLERPMAVVLLAVLHFATDDAEAYAAVARLRRAMAPGSYLVIAHAVPETRPSDAMAHLGQALRPVSVARTRSREEVVPFFEGLELVEPGLVLTPLWRPEGPDDLGLDHPELGLTVVGVGRKP